MDNRFGPKASTNGRIDFASAFDRLKERENCGTSYRRVLSCELQHSCGAIHSIRRDAVTALIAYVDDSAAGIKAEIARIVAHGGDFADTGKGAIACNRADRDRVVQAIRTI